MGSRIAERADVPTNRRQVRGHRGRERVDVGARGRLPAPFSTMTLCEHPVVGLTTRSVRSPEKRKRAGSQLLR